MRALGPGSVSSFLKVILDVFRFVLWALMGATVIAIIGVLLFSFRPDLLSHSLSHIAPEAGGPPGPWSGPIIAALLAGVGLNLAGAIIIVGRLRRIFQTLVAGDPFHPDNVRRLRVIGGTLAALEAGRYLAAALSRLLPDRLHISGSFSVTPWFAVLVMLILSEVFREGARLRREAELTI